MNFLTYALHFSCAPFMVKDACKKGLDLKSFLINISFREILFSRNYYKS